MTTPTCPKCRRLGKRCSDCWAKAQPPLTIPLQIAVTIAKATKETK